MVRVGRELRWARAWVALGLGWWSLVLAPLWAAAQTVTDAARVTTVVDACVPIDIELFHRLLAIELGTSIQYSPDAAQAPDVAKVRVSCTAFGVELQLSDSVTRKAMQRAVELPQVEVAARTRLLALTVAEFVVASWVELQLAKPPIEPVGPAPPSQVTRQARRVARARLPAPDAEGIAWYLGLAPDLMLFSHDAGLLPQLSLQAELRPIHALALGVTFGVAHGEWDAHWPFGAAGSAQLTSTSGRLTLDYVTELGPLELLMGGGARVGLVHMAGKTNLANLVAVELYAPWGGPLLQLSAAVPFAGLRVGLELEAGYVTLPVEALIGELVVSQLRGLWGAAGLRLGWLF